MTDLKENVKEKIPLESYSKMGILAPGWQEISTILLDNAAWHTNPLMKARLARMRLPIIYSGPYCYTSAPVESVCQNFLAAWLAMCLRMWHRGIRRGPTATHWRRRNGIGFK